MNVHEIMWIVFWIIVPIALFVDLFVVSKHKGAVSIKEAAVLSAAWILLALAFNAVVFLTLGNEKGFEFLTAYIMEKSLSVDNMFVFLMIFGYFAVAPENQPKALVWGILGAIVMRFIFIFAGVELISRFDWTFYIFGAILIYTAIKMLMRHEEPDLNKNIAFRLLKKLLPFKADYKGGHFFVRENGALFATPLLATVFVIELSDIVFAVDSIPAVLAVSRDTFIVYTSNIFAIIGLRALYFLLAGMADKFKYLKYGVSLILVYVGLKMILHSFIKISPVLSLAVIAAIVAISILAGFIKKES